MTLGRPTLSHTVADLTPRLAHAAENSGRGVHSTAASEPCYFSSRAMRRGVTLIFVFLLGNLAGCAAAASRGEMTSADSQALRAEQAREHARLLEVEARLVDAERRLAKQAHGSETAPELWSDVTSAASRGKAEPLRSEGDFLAEARVAAPAGAASPACAPSQTAAPDPRTERERLQQLLESLRAYATDPHSGLSLERREALRVLLRRERQLDLMNPWGDR